ncbi:peptidylprolyl isomerase [Actibacterium sp. MT2.3-13A]|uniref:peptidylprolyl isomerase n=1 Tax=Actibacterium sp. MT2.3-13A TaxID=2828332 RepID=UPI001BAA4FB7|nr:peptidylprolyl isomerase [Actibacterium sp. MT2.3-13A]
MTRLTRLFTVLLLVLTAGAATAQQGGPFAPRVIVNDRAITNYEVEQRMLFLKLLNSPGDLEEEAIKGLIDDRLRMDAAKDLGIALEPEQVETGMEEFAGRANLTTEQFVAAIGQGGIAAQTFRDFVEAGIAWREVIRARFGPRAQITETEIDRAIALSSQRGGARVLLSEIILPADTPERKAESQTLAGRLSRDITTAAGFAAAAQQYSVSPSRERGGRIDWLDLATLPPQIAAAVLGLAPGEVSDPIPVTNAIALFQLRAIAETEVAEPETLSIEYARFFLERGTPEEAARVAAEVDTCDDLYGVARGLPEDRLLREARVVAELPDDIALELAKLDEGETALLTRGGAPSLLMLCGRTPALGEDVDRTAVRQRLLNQRLGAYAEGYLAELRADAIIRYP